jgi:LuxR family transcriptional regulator, maltose regulon positive regulatory protein
VGDRSTVGWFRTQPPPPAPHAIARLRLLDRMRSRFDRPLTVVVGGAGHGKTTLLAQAMAENVFDPQGTDIWLACSERDRAPEHLLLGLAQALDADTPGGPSAPTLDDIVDQLLLRSPAAVALIVDDAHLLDDTPSIDTIRELVARLPRNAHLVLAGRTMPAIGIRLHQSRGDADVIEQHDLAFTVDERDQLAAGIGRAGDGADLPSWPALAVLVGAVGRHAGIEYVWDEFLAGLDPTRRRELAKVSIFSVIDDDLVHAVLGEPRTATALLEGLPLVDRLGDSHRLHDLWIDALAGELDDITLAAALAAGGRHQEERGDLVAAARCYADADDTGAVARVARRFASLPLTGGLDAADAEALLALLPDAERAGPLGDALRSIQFWHEPDVAGRLTAMAAAATRIGDDEMLALAWWRLVVHAIDHDVSSWIIPAELHEVAASGQPLGRLALVLAQSSIAQLRVDIDTAVGVLTDIDDLDELDELDPSIRAAAVASRLVALGRPEDVAVTLTEVLTAGATQAIAAQAVWLRGDIAPADAWAVAAALPSAYIRHRMPDLEVPMFATVAGVGLAAGADQEARRLADTAIGLAAHAGRHSKGFAAVADAQCLLVEQGDDAARTRFELELAQTPLEPWPAWPYLTALATIRALVPGSETLDQLPLGPSLALAVEAGRLLAALRDGAPPAVAATLDWTRPRLLEVHVLPPLRCELALAAAATDPAAADHLTTITGHQRWLRRLVDHPNADLAALARAAIADAPLRPDHDLTITTLGSLTVARTDGVAVESVAGRVAQLLGLLVRERSIARAAVAARLWPDLEPGAAANNPPGQPPQAPRRPRTRPRPRGLLLGARPRRPPRTRRRGHPRRSRPLRPPRRPGTSRRDAGCPIGCRQPLRRHARALPRRLPRRHRRRIDRARTDAGAVAHLCRRVQTGRAGARPG